MSEYKFTLGQRVKYAVRMTDGFPVWNFSVRLRIPEWSIDWEEGTIEFDGFEYVVINDGGDTWSWPKERPAHADRYYLQAAD